MNTLKAERAMTPSDKLRGFADKWGFSQDKTEEGFLIDNDRTKQCLSDLTALIEEHYYPKEFVEWMLKCGTYSDVPYREFTLKWNVNIEPDKWQYFTTDELYQYWKENKQC